jgi:hypothetical protein
MFCAFVLVPYPHDVLLYLEHCPSVWTVMTGSRELDWSARVVGFLKIQRARPYVIRYRAVF